MRIVSYAGISGFLMAEFSSHQALRLSELLEKLRPAIPTDINNTYCWFQSGVHYSSYWANHCKKDKTVKSFLVFLHHIEDGGLIERRTVINPLHIDCFCQVLLGSAPTSGYPEVSLSYKNGVVFLHFPDSIILPPPPSIPISQLREEGVDLFDEDALLERLGYK